MMNLNVWAWLRGRSRDAVLAGVGDALAELDQGGEDLAGPLALLRSRLAPALPAPAENANGNGQEETAGRKRKAAAG